MAGQDDERLLEEAVSAWRPEKPGGGLRAHPAWCDLDATARERLFEETARARILEAALDPDGLSTTARAVLRRILAAG